MPDDLFHVGTIIGIHGLRGDLKVRPFSGEETAIDTVETVHLIRSGSTPVTYQVQRASRHKGNILLRVDEITDADKAQNLVGCDVYIEQDDLGELPEGEYYWYELEGLRVSDRNRGDLGVIADLFTTAAHDIYVVRGSFGEILIPAVESFVIAIDVENRLMQVDLPEGMIPESTVDAV